MVRVNRETAKSFFVYAEQSTVMSVAAATAKQGVLHLVVGHEVMREALDEDVGPGIYAISTDADDQTDAIRLRAGKNDLPAGKYLLLTPAWMLEFWVNGQPASPTLLVKPDRPLYVRGTVRTDFPWNLPEIPIEQGSFAEAYGTLFRAGAEGDAPQELTYSLRLTVRNEVEVAGPLSRRSRAACRPRVDRSANCGARRATRVAVSERPAGVAGGRVRLAARRAGRAGAAAKP
jgi:hypothetical protein